MCAAFVGLLERSNFKQLINTVTIEINCTILKIHDMSIVQTDFVISSVSNCN